VNLDLTKKYTYDDYYSWGEEVPRCELIDGIVYMSPAPLANHQRIIHRLNLIFGNYLDSKKSTCEVFPAPFDVRLNADGADDITVQPDLSIICDPRKVDTRGGIGAPDLIVEILSKSTMKHDTVLKHEKYREAGVLEYWIVNPFSMSVHVNTLVDEQYVVRSYADNMAIKSDVFADLMVKTNDIFPPGMKEETDDGA